MMLASGQVYFIMGEAKQRKPTLLFDYKLYEAYKEIGHAPHR